MSIVLDQEQDQNLNNNLVDQNAKDKKQENNLLELEENNNNNPVEISFQNVPASKLITAAELETISNAKKGIVDNLKEKWNFITAKFKGNDESYPQDFIVHSRDSSEQTFLNYKISDPGVWMTIGICSGLLHLLALSSTIAVICGIDGLYELSMIISVISWISLPKWFGIWTSLLSNRFNFQSWSFFVSKEEAQSKVELKFVSKYSLNLMNDLEGKSQDEIGLSELDATDSIINADLTHIWYCLFFATTEILLITALFAIMHWNVFASSDLEHSYAYPPFIATMLSICLYITFSVLILISACAGNLKYAYNIRVAYRSAKLLIE
jgi:hypothetical protein